MKSLHAGTYWGIPVKIHWTFSLLYLMLFGYGLFTGTSKTELLSLSLFIIIMFICVILHEYGHALTARRYGVKTIDIIISPIGGLARLQKLPEKPIQELWVAIAGPLVNLVIAIVLFLIAFLTLDADSFTLPEESIELIATPHGFIVLLIWINCVLFLFNLIPAFPMDGGRIFRALLSMKYGKVTGTKYASILGRVLAVIFMGIGVYFQMISIVFIGMFVFIMARSENRQVKLRSILSSAKAGDIMKTEFTKLHLSNTIAEVYEKYIRGGEKNYVVFDSLGNVSGVLSELFIKQAYKANKLEMTANESMENSFLIVEPECMLDKLFEKMNQNATVIAIIKNGDQIQGVIDRQMLYNFIQLNLSK